MQPCRKNELALTLIPFNLPLVISYYCNLQIKSIIIKVGHLLSYSMIWILYHLEYSWALQNSVIMHMKWLPQYFFFTSRTRTNCKPTSWCMHLQGFSTSLPRMTLVTIVFLPCQTFNSYTKRKILWRQWDGPLLIRNKRKYFCSILQDCLATKQYCPVQAELLLLSISLG